MTELISLASFSAAGRIVHSISPSNHPAFRWDLRQTKPWRVATKSISVFVTRHLVRLQLAHLRPRVRCANAPLSEAERTSYEVQRGFMSTRPKRAQRTRVRIY